MNHTLQYQFCRSCGNRTPLDNFCAYCGAQMSHIGRCLHCYASIPPMVKYCPFCGQLNSSRGTNDVNRKFTNINKYLTYARPAILLIFFISLYSLVQIIIGLFLIPFFPNEITPDSPEFYFFNLMILFITNLLLTLGIVKFVPFSFRAGEQRKNQGIILFLLILLLIVSISFIEIFVTFIDYGLDLINMDPVQSSPYDNFFDNLAMIFLFALIAVIIGPIYEELVYRSITLSILSSKTSSEITILIMGGLIFSLSHTPSDLLEGSLRYTILHFIATFCLGVILGIIFLKWGLKYSIIFHSLWNAFSLLTQLLFLNDLSILIDFMFIAFLGFTLVLSILFFLKIRKSIKQSISEVVTPNKLELLIILINLTLIIIFEVVLPLILFGAEQNIMTAGFILSYLTFGLLAGIFLINKEKNVFGKFVLNR